MPNRSDKVGDPEFGVYTLSPYHQNSDKLKAPSTDSGSDKKEER